MNIQINAKIKVPRVPNFIQLDNNTWLPIYTLSDVAIDQLAKAWASKLKERKREQEKDKDFFDKNASKGGE